MKKLVAATLFCATLAVPAVAQGPHTTRAAQGGAVTPGTVAAEMMPVPGAVAAPVAGTSGLYGGDMAGGKPGTAGAALPAGPAPSIAWILALGFLGLVVLRRTRASTAF